VDLAPLARRTRKWKPSESRKIPSNTVNVVREGRRFCFHAWPYANVLNSVWEFLEKQGVRWVYPDEQGDFVPAGKGVNLGILPLTYTPPGRWRYANFDTKRYGTNPSNDQYLYWWRSRWTTAGTILKYWAAGKFHQRIPPTTRSSAKGWKGSHNFDTVVPNDVLLQHPELVRHVQGNHAQGNKADSPKFGKRLAPVRAGRLSA